MFVYKMRLIKEPHILCVVMHTSVHPVMCSLLVNHIPLVCMAQVSAECEQQLTVNFSFCKVQSVCVCVCVCVCVRGSIAVLSLHFIFLHHFISV